MVNWWKPAADRAIAEWDRKVRAPAEVSLAGINDGSRFYVQRIRAAIDLEIELMDEAAERAIEHAGQCARSEEIADPTAIARETLEPIFNKARELIRAQPATAAARGGNMQFMVEGLVAPNVREAEEAHRVRVENLTNALQQRRAALEVAERREAEARAERQEDREERAVDRAARARKDRFDFWARVVQIVAAGIGAFGLHYAAIASAVIGALALLLHQRNSDPGF
jgi:hypothetical protein